MIQDREIRSSLRRLLGMAQSGQADRARPALTRLLARVRRHGVSPEQAATTYVLAIAELEVDDLDACRSSVERLLSLGASLDEPGWRCCALSLRVVAASRTDLDRAVVDDLLMAEHALRATRELDVRSWATCGLGWAYLSVGCYELAVGPLREATQIPDDVIGLPESSVIDWANLAEAHLRTAFELEQVDHPSTRAALDVERRAAHRAAVQARRAAEAPGVHPRWAVLGETLSLAAGRGVVAVRPAAVADLVRRADEHGLKFEALVASAVLVLVLSDDGDHVAASRAATQALARLDGGYHDDDLNVLLTWAAVRAGARAGVTASEVGLRQARLGARRSRRERIAKVAAVRLSQHRHEHAASCRGGEQPDGPAVGAGGDDGRGPGDATDSSPVTLSVVWDLCERLALPLTHRERIVLTRLCGPARPEAIAAELGLGLTTVRAHTHSIYRTLDVHSRAELVAWVLEATRIDDPAQDTTLALISDPPLTDRQVDVLRALADGRSTQQVADTLGISRPRVLQHVTAIYKKLGVRDRAHALALVRSRRRGP